MSEMDIERVLAQIRSLSAEMPIGSRAPQSSGVNGVGQFAELMRQGVEQVNQTQQRADALADAFERGKPGVELPDVMLELQKASVSFRALTEVRNRLISAYQEIMNIPM